MNFICTYKTFPLNIRLDSIPVAKLVCLKYFIYFCNTAIINMRNNYLYKCFQKKVVSLQKMKL